MVSPSALNRLNDKGRPCGLYLKIEEKNKIKRTLVSFEKETELPPTTIENEIIGLTDVDFKIYENRINLTNEFSQKCILNRRLIRRKHLKIFIETTEEFISAFERDDPLHGVLTRTLLEDLLQKKDLKTSMKESISFTVNAVNHCFSDIMDFRNLLMDLLYDMCDGKELDFKNEFVLLSCADFTQIITMDEGNSPEYYFRAPAYYYLFLLMHFVKNKTNIQICRCCGRFFVPKTKKETLYCDRMLTNGKTCKQWATVLKRKIQVKTDIVLDAYEKNRSKLYKRLGRTEDPLTQTEKSISFDEYYAWLDIAAEARDKYIAKQISAEEALKSIEVND